MWRLGLLFACYLSVIGQGLTAETNLQKQQRRIIALAPHVVEQLFEIGAGEQIIGTTSYADYPEAAKEIPRVGNYARLQVEKILQMQPDLIIAWHSGNPSEDLQRLEKYGITILYSKPKTLEDVATELEILGQATGRQAQSKQVADNYIRRLSNLRKQYQGKQGIKVFYELWPRPLRTVANQAWPQQQLDVCGAENPFVHAQGDYPQVGLEQVVLQMPMVIIQPSQHSADSPQPMIWQKWSQVPAVKHQQILRPNADKVHRMTTRMLDELELMCKQLDKTRQYYQQLRG